ncbi:MAG: U32 family peptidase [Candidatus Omnitrophica bacterium]|nr:U32 family peptidase [Candidatus Omnitrophota bacterium]
MNIQPKYCVGLNGRPGNIEAILEQRGKDIYEVYAAAPPDICTSGRRGHIPVDMRELKRQVRLAHQYRVRYNVVMNGSCLGGIEFSNQFQKKMKDFIQYLDDIEADSTTIMNPFLVDIVRKTSKCIEIIVSSFAEVAEPVKLARFKTRGANRVVLHQNIYRNFEMLKTICHSTDLPLEIIPNQGCLNQCECFISHNNIVSHSSTAEDKEFMDMGNYNFPIQRCRTIRQKDPIEFLMSCFIRPEDLHMYEELGFTLFKFAGRRSSTEWMLNVLNAYILRRYEDNLFDLSSHVGDHGGFPGKIGNLPNNVLDGWFQFMGSNADHKRFYEKAKEFSQTRQIDTYFNNATTMGQ